MLNRIRNAIGLVVLSAAFFFQPNANCFGDEIVIEESNRSEETQVGDFICSPCLTKMGSLASYAVVGDSEIGYEMSAGDLWRFFDEQGVHSVNDLEFLVDIDQISKSDNFGLEGLQVQIQHPLNAEHLLTDVTMQGNSLVVPGYETSSSKPEAKIRLPLGYDFMKEFSSSSTEKVVFNFSSKDASVSPTLFLTSDATFISGNHLGMLFSFIVFWGLVFMAMNRFIRPVDTMDPVFPRNSNVTPG
jgi:hypothetical protein